MPPKGAIRKKLAASDGIATSHIPSLAEQYSYLHTIKPFKNPNYTKNFQRRVRNLKTILAQEREYEKADRERHRQVKVEAEAQEQFKMSVDREYVHPQTREQDEETPTYTSIEAPPSILPQGRYCDITGLEAPYTDPATGLRYHDKSVYEVVKSLNPSTAKEYLSARGVNSIVK